ncbi:MAG: hypothetical protein OXB95_12185 [Rhodobacteraceae bacterium]|nr:hypothetical protein [Paracoccaceae bacterium]
MWIELLRRSEAMPIVKGTVWLEGEDYERLDTPNVAFGSEANPLPQPSKLRANSLTLPVPKLAVARSKSRYASH